MCGIAGYFAPSRPPSDGRSLVKRMCRAIRHRGPDDEGLHTDDDEGIGLGLCRLSIVDLAGGHQPLASDDGTLQVVFNGEIYNHQALRQELRGRGWDFRTASDTEVVLRQLQADGLDGLHRFNGMFAFALWERPARRLRLVRDRLGVKPLYYFWDGRSLLFASELKALLASGVVPAEIEPRGLWDYLTFRYVPGPHTIWRHIHKLPPGHHLTLSAERPWPVIERYWDAPYGQPAQPSGLPPAISPDDDDAGFDREFAALLDDAVGLRLLADVPVGVLLSGGLDSSTVAALATRAFGPGVPMFAVAFADSPETSELAYARQVSAHLGTALHEVTIDARTFLDTLPAFTAFTDEPLADLASIPLYHLCREARQHVKVVLSGEGADELLAGYTFDRVVEDWDRSGGPGPDLRRQAVPPAMTNYMTCADKRALLADPERFDGLPDSLDTIRADFARVGDQPPLHQMLYSYAQGWLVEDLLMKADKMSMAASLELRTPFLDYRLAEWAARTPPRLKVGRDRDGRYQTKAVLRRLARTLLPETIVTRPKRGFPVPVYDWLPGRLRSWATDLLSGPDCRLGEWCRASALAEMLARGVAETEARPFDRHRLWNLLILEIWMRTWVIGR